MKKYQVHKFSFYIHKGKKYTKKIMRCKKIITIELTFHYQETIKSCLFYLQEGKRTNGKMKA